MSREELVIAIVEYMSKLKGVQIDRDLDLVNEGYMDSFTLLDLVVFIENTIGKRVDPDQISMEYFTSVNSLTTWLEDNQFLS